MKMIYRQLLIIIVVMVAMFSCKSEQSNSSSNNSLKVLAWNIWHAGHEKAYPEIGCKETIGIMKQSEADIILMIETYGASTMVADSLGFYHRLLSNNLSIYSRYPIIETYTFPETISTFNFGGVKVDVNGQPVIVFNTWLHYLPDMRLTPTELSEKEILAWDDAGTRDEEIKAILSAIEPMLNDANNIPIIMGGDFNSHSHFDWTESTKDMFHHGGATVNWTVSRNMEDAGFKDSFREINPDQKNDIGITWLYDVADEEGDEELPTRMDRIDYIYYIGDKIEAKESEVYNCILGEQLSFKGKDFLYASDHGFVLTSFVIK